MGLHCSLPPVLNFAKIVNSVLSAIVAVPLRMTEIAVATQLEVLIRRLGEAERRAKLLKHEVKNIRQEISTLQQNVRGIQNENTSSISSTFVLPASRSISDSIIFLDDEPNTSTVCVDGPSPYKRPAAIDESGPSNNKKSKFDFNKENDYVVVYTDGACENNGKPNAKAGIGVWFGDEHPLNVAKPVEGRPTNNTAEIQACVQALQVIKSHEANNKIYHVSLNEDNTISLHWTLDYSSDTIIFEIHLPSEYGWFAVGFSDRGKIFPADYCLLWENREGELSLRDTYANDQGVMHLDKQQDCNGFKAKERDGVIKFTYRRKFDTCDRKDYIIEDGTTHIVWSRGKHKLYQVNGFNISSSPKDSGMIRIHLLKNINAESNLPSYVKTLDVLADKVKVPSDETTYWCHVFKLPEEYSEKHHIYQYESNIQESNQGLVHHMEVFHCEAAANEEIPLYRGNCFAKERPPKTQVCKRVLAAWAMGAPPFTYPEEAALPIGGEKFNPYIMLEIHYNNPEHRADFVDSSGIRFHVSTKLRKVDAGVIELGLEYTDKMVIPPGQESFPLTGYCTSACTSMGLPPEGITIFGSQLHTHLTGIRVFTRHFDAYGKELPEMNRDNHYSTHFQEIRRLKKPVKVLPGHVLITRCDYNTEDRENVTLGGFQITDEMCVNYIHYYPHTDLEVCKSSISDQALNTYFRYMNEWEGQPTSTSQGVSQNYGSIKWNKMRVQLLNEVYNEAPLSMQCNMSSGDRFPGYWENAHIPPIITPLPPPSRKCENII